MLLEFTAHNYKSFREELRLSMKPADEEKRLDYSVMRETAGEQSYEALCSTVIYGPNASGKTNVISALDTFRAIVRQGHIENVENSQNPNPASCTLELIPNTALSEPRPVEFSIRFLTQGILIDYAFSADFGGFLESRHKRKILSEELRVNEKTVFIRNETVTVRKETLDEFSAFFEPGLSDKLETMESLPGWKVSPTRLFLSNGFPSFLSPDLHTLIVKWLSNKMLTFCRPDSFSIIKELSEPEKNQRGALLIELAVGAAISRIGGRNHLAYTYDEERKEWKLMSVVGKVMGQQETFFAIPAELFESNGTCRFANLFPLLQDAFLSGGTLILDEFDASLHPMALMSIINLFHNDEINRHHAQLIFNTHNPIFLNADLFRRDEIKFVERNEETLSSEIYALSDFDPEEPGGEYEDYMSCYFMDRYGAIQDVDFAPLFRKIMDEAENPSDKSEE